MSFERFKQTKQEHARKKEVINKWRADMRALHPTWTKRSRFGNGKFPQRGSMSN